MRLVIATPAYSGVIPPFVSSLMASLDALRARGVDARWESMWGNALLYVLRGELAARAFAEPRAADALVFADGDQAWTPADLDAVLAPVLAGHAEVCGAAIMRRKVDWTRVARAAAKGVCDPEGLARAAADYNTRLSRSPEDEQAKRLRGFSIGTALYAPAAWTGFGLTAISREGWHLALSQTTGGEAALYRQDDGKVLALVNDDRGTGPLYEIFAPMFAVRPHRTGEDTAFCQRVIDGGGRVVVHVNSRVRHLTSPDVVHVAALDEAFRDEGWTFDVEGEPAGAAAT